LSALPSVYNGQEQHYSGGKNPYNREAVWLAGYNTSAVLYEFIASLNGLRSNAIVQAANWTSYNSFPIMNDSNTLALRKGYAGSQVITILSNKGESGEDYTLTLGDTGYASGTELMEVVGCTNITVDKSGDVAVPMGEGAPRILYPAALVQNPAICNPEHYSNATSTSSASPSSTSKPKKSGAAPGAGIAVGVEVFAAVVVHISFPKSSVVFKLTFPDPRFMHFLNYLRFPVLACRSIRIDFRITIPAF
jgi:alpha-amylase